MKKSERTKKRTGFVIYFLLISVFFTACTSIKDSVSNGNLVIREQGSFALLYDLRSDMRESLYTIYIGVEKTSAHKRAEAGLLVGSCM